MKTRSRRQGKRLETIEVPAHCDIEPTQQTRRQQVSSSRRTSNSDDSTSRRKNGQESSSTTTSSTATSSSGMKRKSSTATSDRKRPRTDQPSPATFMPEALSSGFHPALTTSTMPPWSSGQQHPHHQYQVPGSSHPLSNSTSLHNHEPVGILEHILATGSVARAASVRHQGLFSYLHHANKHARTSSSSTTAAIAGPLAIQSQGHYVEKHPRRTNGGHDTASHSGDDGDGETSDRKTSVSVDVSNDTDDLDSNPQMEIETTDRIIDVNGIKLVVGNDFTFGEEEDGDSSSTARASEDDEAAAAAAKAVPTGKAYYSSIGVWPSIELEESRAEKEGTNRSSSKSAAAAAATDQFRASLASDDSWELEHGDGLDSSEITLSGGSAGSVAVDDDRAVLASLVDRCWQRAVHTMSSVVPYDPYGALNQTPLHGPSSASTTAVAEDVEQDEDALAESSSSLVVVRDDGDTTEKEKEEEKEEEEEDRSMIQSILEQEATFVIDSVLHLALTEGKKIAEQRVARSETTENDKETPGNIGDALTWIDIARVLSSAETPATSPVSDGATPENYGQSAEPVSSHTDILKSFTRTVEAQAGMAPIALNDESLRSTLSRLSELFDPSLTMLESESPSDDGHEKKRVL